MVRGEAAGVALKSCAEATKPVFVSVGQRFDLRTAAGLVLRCSVHRVPEPVRQADIRSREYVREHFPAAAAEDKAHSTADDEKEQQH